MRRPSKLSTSSSTGRTNPERSRPPTAERVRRRTAGAAVQTSVESSGGPAVTVSEPSGANASAETTPPGRPSRRLPSSHTSLSPPRLIVQARCARAASSATISTSASSGVSSSGAAPCRSTARRANSLPASQAQSTEPSGSRRAESKATSPSCGVSGVSSPLSGSTRKRSWSNGVFARCTRMPCSDQSTTCDQPPGWASSRRPPPETATTATSKSTPLRPVCVNATCFPSGENAPGTWIASGSSESGSSEPPVASIENSAWRSLPPASRAITQRSSAGRGQRGGDALARERDLLVQAVGRDAPELQEPGDIGQVAELARRQVPGDRGRADLQIALDHEDAEDLAARDARERRGVLAAVAGVDQPLRLLGDEAGHLHRQPEAIGLGERDAQVLEVQLHAEAERIAAVDHVAGAVLEDPGAGRAAAQRLDERLAAAGPPARPARAPRRARRRCPR